jgi:hypothetical protein
MNNLRNKKEECIDTQNTMYPDCISHYQLNSRIFLPAFSVAFEYQGEGHYFSSITLGSAQRRQQWDSLKAEIAKQSGITLISIPFWWDKTPKSLAATIHKHRPDLVSQRDANVIPVEMPEKYRQRQRYYNNT